MEPQPASDTNLIPFITTFSHHLSTFNRSIRQHFRSMQSTVPSLIPFNTIMAYRRNKNLKDILVHTALNKTVAIPSNLDSYFTHLKFLAGTVPGQGAPIWQSFTLLSTNLVYAITCKHCKKIYVGETGATLRQRLYQHLYQIKKNNNNKLLYTHFIQHTISNLLISGLESNPSWSFGQRRATERRWIWRLSSKSPTGFNDA
ncbi:Homeobox protein TGIF2LY [Dissostichus eleginoides]|uniref:Homeobox protein TGIF2LY n=3 Tax=Dissostichus eleginoides TaxID=100907 RepID=A0AAD9B5R3_DISEL|nr:Homeobox protein TGIF2LY [Dissostichus eleginoides]